MEKVYKGNRQEVAKDFAKTEGYDFKTLGPEHQKAYLHNADVIIEQREADVVAKKLEASGKEVCYYCKGAKWMSKDKPCPECNPRGLSVETESPETTEKPLELKPGEYWCPKCQTIHRNSSNIGRKHLKYTR